MDAIMLCQEETEFGGRFILQGPSKVFHAFNNICQFPTEMLTSEAGGRGF